MGYARTSREQVECRGTIPPPGRPSRMTEPDLIDRLAAHRAVGKAAREELAWLASHGSVRHLEPGDVLSAKGTRVEWTYFVLAGRIAITVDRGAGMQRLMEWRAGDVTGLLPYSR